LALSSNGIRTAEYESADRGSIPCGATIKDGVLLRLSGCNNVAIVFFVIQWLEIPLILKAIIQLLHLGTA
jgi:hypothetical protein